MQHKDQRRRTVTGHRRLLATRHSKWCDNSLGGTTHVATARSRVPGTTCNCCALASASTLAAPYCLMSANRIGFHSFPMFLPARSLSTLLKTNARLSCRASSACVFHVALRRRRSARRACPARHSDTSGEAAVCSFTPHRRQEARIAPVHITFPQEPYLPVRCKRVHGGKTTTYQARHA